MTIDYKVSEEKLQYNINKEATKISYRQRNNTS